MMVSSSQDMYCMDIYVYICLCIFMHKLNVVYMDVYVYIYVQCNGYLYIERGRERKRDTFQCCYYSPGNATMCITGIIVSFAGCLYRDKVKSVFPHSHSPRN